MDQLQPFPFTQVTFAIFLETLIPPGGAFGTYQIVNKQPPPPRTHSNNLYRKISCRTRKRVIQIATSHFKAVLAFSLMVTSTFSEFQGTWMSASRVEASAIGG